MNVGETCWKSLPEKERAKLLAGKEAGGKILCGRRESGGVECDFWIKVLNFRGWNEEGIGGGSCQMGQGGGAGLP